MIDTDSSTNNNVAENKPSMGTENAAIGAVSWGPWLFYTALTAGLVFIWWLVIYSHGVTTHH